jgi:hypothetical protein
MVIGYPGSASAWGGSQLVSQASNLVPSVTNGHTSPVKTALTGAPLLQSDVAITRGNSNEWGNWGYNREAKRGKLQIEIGLLADGEAEPLAVLVFKGNAADPVPQGVPALPPVSPLSFRLGRADRDARETWGRRVRL